MEEKIRALIDRMKTEHCFIRSGVWKDIEIDYGIKYAKIVSILSNGQRCAVNFIDLTTGDIYRADSWRQKGRWLGDVEAFFN